LETRQSSSPSSARVNRGDVYSAWRIWLFQCSFAVRCREPTPSANEGRARRVSETAENRGVWVSLQSTRDFGSSRDGKHRDRRARRTRSWGRRDGRRGRAGREKRGGDVRLRAMRPWVSHMWYTWRSEALRVEGREAVVSGMRVVRGCETRDRSCLGARVARRGRRGWSASRAPLRGAGDDGIVHEVVHARESRLFAVLRVRRGGRAGRAERRHRRASRRRVRAARRERREARALDRRSLRGSWRRRIQRQSCDEKGFEAWRYLPAPAARCCGSRIASRHRRA